MKVLKFLKDIGFDRYLVVDIAGVHNILEEAIKVKKYFEDCLNKIAFHKTKDLERHF